MSRCQSRPLELHAPAATRAHSSPVTKCIELHYWPLVKYECLCWTNAGRSRRGDFAGNGPRRGIAGRATIVAAAIFLRAPPAAAGRIFPRNDPEQHAAPGQPARQHDREERAEEKAGDDVGRIMRLRGDPRRGEEQAELDDQQRPARIPDHQYADDRADRGGMAGREAGIEIAEGQRVEMNARRTGRSAAAAPGRTTP